jgi:hypothetical protein
VYESNPFTVQLNLGGRVEYLIDERYRFQFQPMLSIPLTSALKSPYGAWLPALQLNFGLSIPLDKIGKKEGDS